MTEYIGTDKFSFENYTNAAFCLNVINSVIKENVFL